MPDRPFEQVPELPWKPTHLVDNCDQCGARCHQLFLVIVANMKKWVCRICHDGAEKMQVET